MAGRGVTMADEIYDKIGVGYSAVRTPDPRIDRQIWSALGESTQVVNVGAGSGSYERSGRVTVAVEPSQGMINQRPPSSALAVRAVAEYLPFDDDTFDAAMAILTVHHWNDPERGLRELRRVSRGPVVVFTFDTSIIGNYWLVDYLNEQLDQQLAAPSAIAELIGGGRVETVPVPHDCTDGFGEAYWRRPEAYLDPKVRAGISSFARRPQDAVNRALVRLKADIDSGRWAAKHADLLRVEEFDAGFRLVIG